ncbi:MAG TPA: anthranilate phosphoribosyltransferase [Candidatus Eremiobacteraceae bacterium]|nr:anthranilate phosphoribosyltransferase [Candidatus Eremiobacteraceae bacterium]
MSALAAGLDPSVCVVSQIVRAAAGADLSAEEMRQTINAIMDGVVTPAQAAALLVALAVKGETADEVVGAASAMREHAIPVSPRGGAIDVCGTGGDGSGTFNISTAVAFVVAGAGVPVAKHGNRAMSSRCGSADVLEALGVRIDVPPQRSAALLGEHGIAFMFAQVHHPAMRHVAPVRREIGMKTLFNLLGPLTNPAAVRRQVVGVAHAGAQDIVAAAIGRLGSDRAAVIRGCDGLDEATLAGATRVLEWSGLELVEYDIVPEDAGLERAPTEALAGGDAQSNAHVIREVLRGKPGAQRDVVLLNAALALFIAGVARDLQHGRSVAQRSIDTGAASDKLDVLRRESRR